MSDAETTSDAGATALAPASTALASTALASTALASTGPAGDVDRFSYDVVVIGAGGSGLR